MEDHAEQLGLFDLGGAGSGPAQPLEEALPDPALSPPAQSEPASEPIRDRAVPARTAASVYRPPSGAVSRVRANLAAAQLVNDVDAGSVELPLTAEQRTVLGQWSSWGAVPGVFDPEHDHLGRFADDVREQLDGQGAYEKGRRTVLNAHYTSEAVARRMWEFAQTAGYGTGRGFEPGCGAGMFIAAAPDGIQMTGVEADPTTARIAQLLHPDARVVTSELQTWEDPGGFDLAIGNVPFSAVKPFDARLSRDRELSLHNYCLLRSLDLLRPGGMLIALTSMWTMDAHTRSQRETLSRWGEFLGAVRLPNTAFQENAGTSAVTDMVVMRRRDHVLESLNDTHLSVAELSWLEASEQANGWRVSRWYRRHSDLMLGELAQSTMYGGEGHTVVPHAGQDFEEALRGALSGAVMTEAAADLSARRDTLAAVQLPQTEATRLPTEDDAAGQAREGTIIADGQRFLQLRRGVFVPFERPAKRADPEGSDAELRAAIAVRDAGLKLLAAEKADVGGLEIAALRADLNDAYGVHQRLGKGPLSRRPVYASGRSKPHRLSGFADDPHYGFVCALEDPALVQAGEDDVRGEWFRTRAIGTSATVRNEAVDTIEDAVAVSVHQTGAVWLDVVNDLLGAKLRAEDLAPHAFMDPESVADGGEAVLEAAARYLSGPVRDKLQAAQAAVDEGDTRFEPHVRALERVCPELIPPEGISVSLGVPWVTQAETQAFVRDTLGHQAIAVTRIDGDWQVDTSHAYLNHSVLTEVWGTPLMPADRLLEQVLSHAELLVRNPKTEDGAPTVNAEQTMTALAIAERWQTAFARWCLVDDPERREMLAERYNTQYNGWVVADYPQWRRPEGLIASFEYRPHQLKAITRIILEGGMCMGHEVGSGKTATMAGAAMEMRRLGIARRPFVAVPNSLVSQFAGEWQRLFPAADLLVYDPPSNRPTKEYRNEFGARCATGDWDGVICSYSGFAALPVSSSDSMTEEMSYLAELKGRADTGKGGGDWAQDRAMRRHLKRRVTAQERKVRTAVAASRGLRTVELKEWSMSEVLDAASRTVKEQEQARLKRQEALRAASASHDSTLSWEDLDCDYLMVDEGHLFKNLRVESKSPLVRSASSTRAMDLDRKLRWLRNRNDGASRVTIATGTPVANALHEMWVMQNYTQPEILERTGLSHFDSWLAMFGRQEIRPEVDFKGAWRMNTILAGYANVPELMAIAGQDIELLTSRDLGLPRPDLEGDDARIVEIPNSPEIKDFIDALAARETRVRTGTVEPAEDNMLAIYGAARAAALDLRLVGREQPEPNKISAAADEIAAIWAANKDREFEAAPGVPHPRPGALQMVFCDPGTPGGDSKLNVYEQLRSALTRRGMDPDRIAFFHDRGTAAAKIARFDDACRTGGFDVLVASTQKAGVGLNVQARLAAMHHLDAPWRPDEVIQREGRMLRQGNQCESVEIVRYVQLGTFDSFAWQVLQRKATLLEELTALAPGTREAGKLDADLTSSFGHVKAVATGDPRMIRELELTDQIKRLRTARRAHEQAEMRVAAKIVDNDSYTERLLARRGRLEAAQDMVESHGDRAVLRTLDGTRIDSDPNRTLRDVAARECANRRGERIKIASVNGLPVRVTRGELSVTWAVGNDLGLSSRMSLEDERAAKPAQRVVNLVREIPKAVSGVNQQIENTRSDTEALRSQQTGDWPQAAALAEVENELTDLQRDIRENPIEDLTAGTEAATADDTLDDSLCPASGSVGHVGPVSPRQGEIVEGEIAENAGADDIDLGL